MAKKVTASVALDFHVAASVDALVRERGLDSRSAVIQEIITAYLDERKQSKSPMDELPWKNVTANAAVSSRRYFRLDAGYGRVARLEYDGKHPLYYPTLTLEEDGQVVDRETLTVSPHEYVMYLASTKVVLRWPALDTATAPELGLWMVDLEEVRRAA